MVSPLAQFLIDRACASPIVANFLHWYLKVETEDEDPWGLLFRQIFDSFLIQLASSPVGRGNGSIVDQFDSKNTDQNLNQNINQIKTDGVFQGAECALQLYALNEYITRIFECHSLARAVSGRKDVKQAALRKLLAERGLENIPCGIEGVKNVRKAKDVFILLLFLYYYSYFYFIFIFIFTLFLFSSYFHLLYFYFIFTFLFRRPHASQSSTANHFPRPP